MAFRVRQLAFLLTPPLLACTLLAGIVAEQRTHIKPVDVEPYHARARAAIEAVPYVIGYWTGKDDDIPPAAQKLLRPNAILSRTYIDTQPSARGPRVASLLIVQCRDSRDMVGHYPPICYRAQGARPRVSPAAWAARKKVLSATGVSATPSFPVWSTVFSIDARGNFGVRRSITSSLFPVRASSATCRVLPMPPRTTSSAIYGAAQFQVVFNSLASEDLSQAEHDEIFATLMAPNLSLIQTLTSGGLK